MSRQIKTKSSVVAKENKGTGENSLIQAGRSQSARILSGGIRRDVDLVRLLLAVATDVVDERITTAAGRCIIGATSGVIKIAELNLRHGQQILPPLGRGKESVVYLNE